jgi:hypothetical protein
MRFKVPTFQKSNAEEKMRYTTEIWERETGQNQLFVANWYKVNHGDRCPLPTALSYLTGFRRFIGEIPESGQRELHGDIYDRFLHPLPHYGEQLLHVVGVGAQLARLLRRNFGS